MQNKALTFKSKRKKSDGSVAAAIIRLLNAKSTKIAIGKEKKKAPEPNAASDFGIKIRNRLQFSQSNFTPSQKP